MTSSVLVSLWDLLIINKNDGKGFKILALKYKNLLICVLRKTSVESKLLAKVRFF